MKVFIADDSSLIRERLRDMLSELPETETIGEAGDALEATKAILKLQPDVVILDIRMPGGNGIDVLKHIKKNEPDPIPVVIILTNCPYPQYRKKCMALGADYFFDKSADFEKITEVLKKFIRKRGSNLDY